MVRKLKIDSLILTPRSILIPLYWANKQGSSWLLVVNSPTNLAGGVVQDLQIFNEDITGQNAILIHLAAIQGYMWYINYLSHILKPSQTQVSHGFQWFPMVSVGCPMLPPIQQPHMPRNLLLPSFLRLASTFPEVGHSSLDLPRWPRPAWWSRIPPQFHSFSTSVASLRPKHCVDLQWRLDPLAPSICNSKNPRGPWKKWEKTSLWL